MSLVKQVDPAKPAPEAAPAPSKALAEAREQAEKAVLAELHRVEDVAAVAIKALEGQAAAARRDADEAAARHAALQKEYEALAAKHAAAEKDLADARHKLEVLHELKAKLDAL